MAGRSRGGLLPYNIVVPDSSKIWFGNYVAFGVGEKIDGHAQMQFYQNDYAPNYASILASFTASTCPGIGSYLLTGGTNAGINQTDFDLITWPLLTATSSSGSGFPYTVYGYWVTSTYDGALLWCQQFETPFQFWAPGIPLTLLPVFSFCQCATSEWTPAPTPASVVWGVQALLAAQTSVGAGVQAMLFDHKFLEESFVSPPPIVPHKEPEDVFPVIGPTPQTVVAGVQALLQKVDVDVAGGVNALLASPEETVSAGVNALLSKYPSTVSAGVSALLQKVAVTVAAGVSALLVHFPTSVANGVSALLQKLNVTVASGVSALLQKVAVTVAAGVSALLKKVGLTVSSGVNALLASSASGPSVVNNSGSGNVGGGDAVTFYPAGSATASGNLLVVLFGAQSGFSVTLTTPAGWTLGPTVSGGAIPQGTIAIYYKISAGETGVTVSNTGTIQAWAAYEVELGSLAGTLDLSKTSTGSGTAISFGPYGPTASASEIGFAFMYSLVAGGATTCSAAKWNSAAPTGTNYQAPTGECWQVLAAIGNQSASCTAAGSDPLLAAMATFK